MNHPRFAAWLCSAAALVLLAVPAFAQQPDALPPEDAPAAQVQPAEEAPAEQAAQPAPDGEAPAEEAAQPAGEATAADPPRTHVGQGRPLPPTHSAPMWRWGTASFPA